MGRLIYSAIVSLDGYVADETGSFDWAMPDEAVHTYLNDLERPVGTHLYGRRMYEVMAAWEDLGAPEHPAYIRDYAALWKAAEKVVYSGTLKSADTTKTRLEREFVPDAIREMKRRADRDISIGGPTLARAAIEAGLVDEYIAVVTPVVVGGGLRFLPEGARLNLELLGERGFANGMVLLRYRASVG